MVGKFALALGAGTSLALLFAAPAIAQTPVRGGILTNAVFGAPPNLDCHALPSSAHMILLAPAYSTLLRYDPDNYPNIIGDLAASWTVSPDRLTYTFKLIPNVSFHDGSILNSADIKASYDRLRNPPQGVSSLRISLFTAIDSIDTPDPLTVVFKLSKENPSMLQNFANPYNCIYSAKKLAENPKYPETNMMGTGPFKYVEFVPGTSITQTRFDNYFNKGLPYLDGLKQFFFTGPAFFNALAGGQADAAFSQLTPPGRETIRAAQGDKMTFPTIPYNITNMVNVNTTKGPTADIRVRRALQLALDRRAGEILMGKVSNNKGFGVFFAADVKLDMTDEEIAKLPGFNPEIDANRAEARKLLAEAGQSNLKLSLLNRNTGEPYTTLGIFVIDQLRQIGVTVEQRLVDTSTYFSGMSGLNFDIAIDANVTVSSDPSEVLTKMLPNSNLNFTGAKDPILQELYDKQAVETDQAKRRALVIEFEKRVVDQAYILPMFRSVTLAAVATNVKGWKLLPSPLLNVDMRQVWKEK